ncbi:hypothetical protein PsorP6_004112 [Peronosclerospora sorghi]|uniref:Uncharacterized protein n=1 Tax=Peronosclerospora sorghi TaxID=230839 RepID=A0ACC0VJ90_9STRA|nr:hypothetical protein PsorP6_004112 [Peronosclerospora sorghi]
MFAGVDIGGTGVKVGIVTSKGSILAREYEKYHPEKLEPLDVVELTGLNLENLDGIGIGCPGVVKDGGIIHAAANFPSWADVPLQQLLADTLGHPVTVCNDADAAILAEQWVGAASGGINDFIMLSTMANIYIEIIYLANVRDKIYLNLHVALGTGIGFGVVENGQLVRGGTSAIEGGHMVQLDCFKN